MFRAGESRVEGEARSNGEEGWELGLVFRLGWGVERRFRLEGELMISDASGLGLLLLSPLGPGVHGSPMKEGTTVVKKTVGSVQ